MSLISFLLEHSTLNEDRADYAMKQYHDKLKQAMTREMSPLASVEELVQKITDIAPSPKHIPWLIKLYANRGWLLEDGPRLAMALTLFEKHKSKMPKKDLGQITTKAELYQMTDAVKDQKTQKEQQRDDKQELWAQCKVYIKTSTLVVASPTTEEAAKFLGRGTTWCTSADEDNMFERYNSQAPLVVVIYEGKKYQWWVPDVDVSKIDADLHLPYDHTDGFDYQFMDSEDEEVDDDLQATIVSEIYNHNHQLVEVIPGLKILVLKHGHNNTSHPEINFSAVKLILVDRQIMSMVKSLNFSRVFQNTQAFKHEVPDVLKLVGRLNPQMLYPLALPKMIGSNAPEVFNNSEPNEILMHYNRALEAHDAETFNLHIREFAKLSKLNPNDTFEYASGILWSGANLPTTALHFILTRSKWYDTDIADLDVTTERNLSMASKLLSRGNNESTLDKLAEALTTAKYEYFSEGGAGKTLIVALLSTHPTVFNKYADVLIPPLLEPTQMYLIYPLISQLVKLAPFEVVKRFFSNREWVPAVFKMLEHVEPYELTKAWYVCGVDAVRTNSSELYTDKYAALFTPYDVCKQTPAIHDSSNGLLYPDFIVNCTSAELQHLKEVYEQEKPTWLRLPNMPNAQLWNAYQRFNDDAASKIKQLSENLKETWPALSSALSNVCIK